jgi:hypothetical protein
MLLFKDKRMRGHEGLGRRTVDDVVVLRILLIRTTSFLSLGGAGSVL